MYSFAFHPASICMLCFVVPTVFACLLLKRGPYYLVAVVMSIMFTITGSMVAVATKDWQLLILYAFFSGMIALRMLGIRKKILAELATSRNDLS